MKHRGRKSTAELSVISPEGVTAVRRPEPPEELSDEAADEWRALVNSRPADWFPRECHALLLAYCNTVVTMNRLQQLIDRIEQPNGDEDELNVDRYEKLVRIRRAEHAEMSKLLTRMRCTPQSRYSNRREGTGGVPASQPAKKPWQ